MKTKTDKDISYWKWFLWGQCCCYAKKNITDTDLLFLSENNLVMKTKTIL
jgi:hypothetical protein